VADWRPETVYAQKWKKGDESTASLRLVRTPDILASVRAAKGERIFVGFAAETECVEEEALRKLRSKGLDVIVANDVSRTDAGFGSDANAVIFFHRSGAREALPLMSKDEVADRLLDFVSHHESEQ
jgi:phosphopantothenoylcysteine decarboxylase/phosphopantothenate--cysteine ligase